MSAGPYTSLTDFLPPDAKSIVNELAARGIDADLSIAYLEASCGEASLYDEPLCQDEVTSNETKRHPR